MYTSHNLSDCCELGLGVEMCGLSAAEASSVKAAVKKPWWCLDDGMLLETQCNWDEEAGNICTSKVLKKSKSETQAVNKLRGDRLMPRRLGVWQYPPLKGHLQWLSPHATQQLRKLSPAPSCTSEELPFSMTNKTAALEVMDGNPIKDEQTPILDEQSESETSRLPWEIEVQQWLGYR